MIRYSLNIISLYLLDIILMRHLIRHISRLNILHLILMRRLIKIISLNHLCHILMRHLIRNISLDLLYILLLGHFLGIIIYMVVGVWLRLELLHRGVERFIFEFTLGLMYDHLLFFHKLDLLWCLVDRLLCSL